jgi:integrase
MLMSSFMENDMTTRRKKTVTKQAHRRGQMRPFTLEQVAMLEAILVQDGSGTAIRDRALLRVGIDSMLRSSDIVALTLRDLYHNGVIAGEFATKQRKTGIAVQCDMSERTQEALSAWLALNPDMALDGRVFAITTRQHQRIVKQWCNLLKLDGALYSTHSIRRTKAAYIYAKTKNLAAVKELLGHANVAATGVYLGVNNEDARKLARQFPI